jgi:hypothetical protein
MKLFIIFFILITLSISVEASSFPGEYELSKGPKNCPEGFLALKNNQLIFGSRHSWILGESDKGETREVVEGGCTYLTNYEKSESKITIKTTRSSCPSKNENALIDEELELKNNSLIYSFKSNADEKNKSHFQCEYKKSVTK